jgi:C-terminal of Roc, COR, domain
LLAWIGDLLGPNWLTDAIYALLHDGAVVRNQGVFDREMLGLVLRQDPSRAPKYSDDRLNYIIDMMQKDEFSLCHPLPGSAGKQTYLLPEALPPEALVSADTFGPQALRFRYSYVALRRGLMPQFQVKSHELFGPKARRWRSGCVLEFEGCSVLVDGDLGRKRVDILVNGPENRRREALAVVRSIFGVVHAAIPECEPSERIPLPDDVELDVSYEHIVKMEEQFGPEKLYNPEGTMTEYKVGTLLDGVTAGARSGRPSLEQGAVIVNVGNNNGNTNANSPGSVFGDSNALVGSTNSIGSITPASGVSVPENPAEPSDRKVAQLADYITIYGAIGALVGLGIAFAYLKGQGKDYPWQTLAGASGFGLAVGAIAALLIKRRK